jgi:hypothetical protein
MKVLVLGTSNSILKRGWVPGFRSALRNAVVENRSVGASPGIQFALEAQTDFSRYDVVFFDSIPNDQEYAGLNALDADRKVSLWNDIIYDLCSIISSSARLVILGFCHRDAIASDHDVYTCRHRIAELLGVQFIDIRSMIVRLLETGLYTVEQLYGDHPAHIAEWLAFEIGHHIGAIVRLEPTSAHRKSYYGANHFSSLPAETISDTICTRENSYLSMRTVQLGAGFQLQLPETHECLGFSINLAQTHCCLQLIDCSGAVCAEYLCYYANDIDVVRKIFVPVLVEGKLKSLLVKGDSTPNAFRTAFSAEERDPSLEIQFELSAVAFWKRPLFVGHPTPSSASPDVLRFSNEVFTRLTIGRAGAV